jgi:preprotein translocase subunit SecA
LGAPGLTDLIFKAATEFYARKEEQLGTEMMARLEKMSMLQIIDSKWRDHLREMDDLKEGIHLRGYGQKDPLVEYKGEAFKMFMELMDLISEEVVGMVFKLYPERPEQLPTHRIRRPLNLQLSHDSASGAGFVGNREPVPGETGAQAMPRGLQAPASRVQTVRVAEKVGRNDPCPCGSGKKYKNCHGKDAG